MAGGTTPNRSLPTLPDLPTDKNDWQRLRFFLSELKRRFEATVQNPDPPDQVNNLTVTLGAGGFTLAWNPSNRATEYNVFRAVDTIQLKKAVCVATIPRSVNPQFFDAVGNTSGAKRRTYWILPLNGLVPGPISASVNTTAVVPTGSGDVTGPASAVDGDLAVFDGITGKLIKDGGAAPTGTNTGDVTLAGSPDYLTISGQVITQNDIDLLNDVSGRLPFANIPAAAPSTLVGRQSGSSGDYTPITLGSGVSMSAGGVLSATGSGGTGDVVGPSSAVSGNIAIYDGTTGKLIKDGGAIPVGGLGGGVALQPFRLTLSSGNPIYAPLPATPTSTDTTAETVTFAAPHGWTVGTMVTSDSSVGGVGAGTVYFIHVVSATTVSFHNTVAQAIAGTSPINLTSSVTAKITPSGVSNSTLYFSPVVGKGSQISLFDGAVWSPLASSEVSIALGTLTSALPYDVFAYNNSGTLTLELLAWTSDTARATALVSQNGVWVKTGATTRRYVGTIRTDSTTTTIDDGGGLLASSIGAKRFVWNMDNRTDLKMLVRDPASAWLYATNTYRSANASTANRLQFVIGIDEDMVQARVQAMVNASGTMDFAVGLALDATNRNDSDIHGGSISTGSYNPSLAVYAAHTGIGFHFLQWVESANGGTATIYGNNGTSPARMSGAYGILKG